MEPITKKQNKQKCTVQRKLKLLLLYLNTVQFSGHHIMEDWLSGPKTSFQKQMEMRWITHKLGKINNEIYSKDIKIDGNSIQGNKPCVPALHRPNQFQVICLAIEKEGHPSFLLDYFTTKTY